MAGAIITTLILLAAAFAARKQFAKGAWRKSCVGCAGHCGSANCPHTAAKAAAKAAESF